MKHLRFNRAGLLFSLALIILLLGSMLHVFAGYTLGNSPGHAWGSDDAYISYRYAQNLVLGHGLVYNPGERVEGYTNFLWVLIIALGRLVISPDNIYAFSCLLNLFLVAIMLFIFYRYTRNRFGEEKAILASFLFALCPPIWVWVGSGTEAILVLLVQLATWVTVESILQKQQPMKLLLFGVLLIFSILLRADGFILPLIVILYLLIKKRYQLALFVGGVALFAMAPYFLWRYEYYGYLLPNTYYAKVSGPLLLRIKAALIQLELLIYRQGLIIYLLAFLFIGFKFLTKEKQQNTADTNGIGFPGLFIIVWLSYWLYIGGDHFDERFLLILFPMGIVAWLAIINNVLKKKWVIFLIAITFFMQLRPLIPLGFYQDKRFRYSISKYDSWITLGKFLGKQYPGKTIAVGAAGKIPYFSGLKTIDMLGLNDKHIAHGEATFFSPGHNKYDADYVLSKKPDIIIEHIFSNFDLMYDLGKNKYEKEGYTIKYLVNFKPKSKGNDIIDVQDFDGKEKIQLMSKGYDWAVLVRSNR